MIDIVQNNSNYLYDVGAFNCAQMPKITSYLLFLQFLPSIEAVANQKRLIENIDL